MKDRIYKSIQILPDNGSKVLCFGHKTYCCKEDMDENPDWHKATFNFKITSYKLKPEFPEDIEESVLEYAEVSESWDIEEVDYGANEHVIGVTKWQYL